VLVERGPFTGENRLTLHNVDKDDVDAIQESDRSLRLLRRRSRRVMRTEFCRTDSIFREIANQCAARKSHAMGGARAPSPQRSQIRT
jgi:hypothetical protein